MGPDLRRRLETEGIRHPRKKKLHGIAPNSTCTLLAASFEALEECARLNRRFNPEPGHSTLGARHMPSGLLLAGRTLQWKLRMVFELVHQREGDPALAVIVVGEGAEKTLTRVCCRENKACSELDSAHCSRRAPRRATIGGNARRDASLPFLISLNFLRNSSCRPVSTQWPPQRAAGVRGRQRRNPTLLHAEGRPHRDRCVRRHGSFCQLSVKRQSVVKVWIRQRHWQAP